MFRPRSNGVHPRHSPRTFPLGLLAPRCLGFLLILAIPALRSGGEGRRLFGGRKESFPQLRLVSAGLDQPAQPTPFLVFILEFSVSLPLRISVLQDYGGAHPLVMDALAEMSEAQIQMRLTHPPVRAQYPRRRKKRRRRGCSLVHIFLESYAQCNTACLWRGRQKISSALQLFFICIICLRIASHLFICFSSSRVLRPMKYLQYH